MGRAAAVLQRRLGAVAFERHGPPQGVLGWAEGAGAAPGAGQVQVAVRAFPVLPEDVRAVQGTSVVRSSTGIAGSVAVGTVKSVGTRGLELSVGDLVLVVTSTSGVWADSVTVSASSAWKLPLAALAPEDAAMLPAALSAHRILSMQRTLATGDTVVVSNADTAVGRALAALCSHRGLKLVDLPTAVESKDPRLLAAGRVKLAVAQSSGSTVLALSRALQHGGVLVCVAGAAEPLSRDLGGVTVPVSPLIFSSVAVRGFDFGSWALEPRDSQGQGEGVDAALAETLGLVGAGKLNLASLRGGARVYAAKTEAGAAAEAVRLGAAAAVVVL